MLWFRLLRGTRGLLALLLGREAAEHGGDEDPLRAFSQVQADSLALEPFENTNWLPYAMNWPLHTAFPGPHHLASLLLSAGQELLNRSVFRVEPPPPVDSANWAAFLGRLASTRPYLWSNHKQAVESGYLASGYSAVASFPTGAGKSLLADLKIASTTLADGAKVVYLAPTHALIGQVIRNLREVFPAVEVKDSVIAERYYAEMEEPELPDISVMTPERCLLLQSLYPDAFSQLGLLIFDECHLLHPDQGVGDQRSLDAMMCLLGILEVAPNADVLLLSAMMSNATELATWLTAALGRPTVPLDLAWKPTRQARGCVVYESGRVQELEEMISRSRQRGETLQPGAALKRTLTATPHGLFCLHQTWQSKNREDYSLLKLLPEEVKLDADRRWRLNPHKNFVAAVLAARLAEAGIKTLVFCQNRDWTSSIATKVNGLLEEHETAGELEAMEREHLESAADEMGGEDYVLGASGASAGVHHSLLLPPERRLVESLFSRPSGLAVLVATPTLAQGMNLPAEAVIIAGDDRFDTATEKAKPLEAHELLNAAGRAGRAGHFAQGIVLVIPSKVVQFDATSNTIARHWFDMQEAVFSKSDQCLEIDDPVELALDKIHLVASGEAPELDYFLRRLPIDDSGDSELTKRFLGRSLAAYHAQRQQEWSVFVDRVDSALDARRSLLLRTGPVSWLDKVAIATGVEAQVAADLFQALQTRNLDRSSGVPDWISWAFKWLIEDRSRLRRLVRPQLLEDFFSRELSETNDEVLPESLLDILVQLSNAWVAGSPLVEFESLLGTPPHRLGKCMRARKFALRVVPEISFALGLIPQIWRAFLRSEESDAPLPISVATLAGCFREGYDVPEKLAVHVATTRGLTRRGVHRVYERIAANIPDGEPNERFAQTLNRVQQALEMAL